MLASENGSLYRKECLKQLKIPAHQTAIKRSIMVIKCPGEARLLQYAEMTLPQMH